MKVLVAALCAVAAIATPAAAAEWWFVATGNNSSYFVDRSSVVSKVANGHNVYAAWLAYFNGVPNEGVKSAKHQSYFDCSASAMAVKSYIHYNYSGDVVASDTNSDYGLFWSPVAPGTIGEAELAFVCNYQQGEGQVAKFGIGDNSFEYVQDLEKAAALLTPKRREVGARPRTKKPPHR